LKVSYRNYGYVRVSSKDQNIDRQIDAIKKSCPEINERDIFIDKQTGKNFERKEYQMMKRSIRPGDVLFIKSIDRFGRSKNKILEEWRWLVENGIEIMVIDMPLLDTRKYKQLEIKGIGSLIANIVLEVLSWLAEEERIRIKKRQREGIDAAKERGVHLGRPRIKITKKFKELYPKWKNDGIMTKEFIAAVKMSTTTFYRRVKDYEEELERKKNEFNKKT